jgi:ribonuclease HI
MAERERARKLNRVIDEALLDPASHGVMTLYGLAGSSEPVPLAERVRRRAARLGARACNVARHRDALMAAVYAAAAPRGWFNAWCDGSSSRVPPGRSGVGGLVMDCEGKIVARVARFLPGPDPFTAEIAAAAAVLQAALDAGAKQLRVHTDCVALARLWNTRRGDTRLDTVRALARAFRALAIRPIPRAHNEPAHQLARAGLAEAPRRSGR